jgi:hypothetical protein
MGSFSKDTPHTIAESVWYDATGSARAYGGHNSGALDNRRGSSSFGAEKAQGVSVDSLLRQAVLRTISAAPQADPEQVSPQQWEKEFGDWLDSFPSLPALSDEAISRESIYTREDEWR